MRRSPPISFEDPESNAEVTATHMISAVTYLIQVAEDAGLARIGQSLETLRADLVQAIADMRADEHRDTTRGRAINHH
jgi:hypothetical protein